MSMSPGQTILPVTSIVRIASVAGMFGATAAILPLEIATSAR
jgi:hypothetical protein